LRNACGPFLNQRTADEFSVVGVDEEYEYKYITIRVEYEDIYIYIYIYIAGV